MIEKKRSIRVTFILVWSAFILCGCGGQSATETAKNVGNTNGATPAQNNNAVNPSNSPTPAINNTATPSVVKDNKPSPVVKAPTPQIGSGGDDFSLFTQARNALGSDKELVNAVIIEIKEGNASLSGKVSSEAQKAKAEQIVQGVKGIKSVRNNLRVSP